MFAYRITLLGLCAALISSPAYAVFDWWVIHGAGQKPSRVLMFADADAVDPGTEVTREGQIIYITSVSVEEVFESAASPDSIKYRFQVNCEQGTLRKAIVSKFWRDGRKEMTPIEYVHTQTFAVPAPDSWYSQIIAFACNTVPRTRENGMWHPEGKDIHPAVIAWKLWPDGKEPPHTFTKSFEEMKAENQMMLERAKAKLDSDTRAMTALLDKYNKEDGRPVRQQAPRDEQGVMQSVRTQMLDPYIGRSEAELIARFGPPTEKNDSNGVRDLIFDYQQRPSQQRECLLAYALREDKAVEYFVTGQDCTKVMLELPSQ